MTGRATAGGLARLSLRMLRYRVALMLWMFLLLGAFRGGQGQLGWRHAVAALTLGCSYVAATAINDVADEAIDRVNHPRDPGRPLVSGEATARDLRLLHAVAGALAVAVAAPLGPAAVAIVGLGVLIGHLYSAGPARLSYRTLLAPLVLTVAYVLVPFSLGVVVDGDGPLTGGWGFPAGLMALFLARITLKDFRDREGDRRYGKPTLLLRFGKIVTCLVSLAALLLGDLALVLALRPPLWLGILVQGYVAAVAGMLRRLWASPERHAEQVSIGIGARLGNGLLLTLLGWLVLSAHGAGTQDQVVLALTVAALFAGSSAVLLARPQEAVIGYKG